MLEMACLRGRASSSCLASKAEVEKGGQYFRAYGGCLQAQKHKSFDFTEIPL